MPVKAVVLAQPPEADGRTPMDPTRPNELLSVANRPILFHGLETMAAAGIRDVAIAVTPQTEGPIREAVGQGTGWGLDVSYLARQALARAGRSPARRPRTSSTGSRSSSSRAVGCCRTISARS